ncbi:hypothetical protein A2U01_0095352, partial [Trifolium medium]|nr:hypothetical protein [Trifolium medium]
MEETLTQFMKMTQGNFEVTQGGFGGNTTDNPRNESCNAIHLRSRKVPSPEVGENSKKRESKKGVV